MKYKDNLEKLNKIKLAMSAYGIPIDWLGKISLNTFSQQFKSRFTNYISMATQLTGWVKPLLIFLPAGNSGNILLIAK